MATTKKTPAKKTAKRAPGKEAAALAAAFKDWEKTNGKKFEEAIAKCIRDTMAPFVAQLVAELEKQNDMIRELVDNG